LLEFHLRDGNSSAVALKSTTRLLSHSLKAASHRDAAFED